MSKINVLHCVGIYLKNTENWLFKVINNLPDTNIFIASRCFLKTNFYPPEFKYLEFPLNKIPVYGKKDLGTILFNNIVSFTLKSLYPAFLCKTLKNTKIDIIHSHFANVGWYYHKLAKKIGAKHVISFYGYDYECIPFKNPKWIKRYKKLFREADLFLCEGNYGAKLLEKMGCPKEKIKVSRLGVDVDKIPFFERNKKENELNLVQIARITEKKGHIYTIKAFIEALKTCPNMTLTLVGQDNKEGILQEILKEIKDNSIEDKVKIIEYIDYAKLYDFLKDFHAFIHPSCYSKQKDCEGGAPIVFLDAEATGIPVISTTHCDIPDEVIDGKTGFLTPEKDIEQLKNSIVCFYNMNNEEYQKFAFNGRTHIQSFYDSKKNSIKLRGIYEKLINGE